MADDQPLLCSVNGRVLPADAPALAALDRGLLYGDGLFETLRAYDRLPFLLDDHLARLNASAAALRLAEPLDPAVLRRDVLALLDRNRLRDAYLRITLTRGLHAGPLVLEPAARPTLAILARPLRPLPPSLYEEGVALVTASIRQNADSPLPRHKTLNYLGNLLARTEARDRGADDALLLNTRGQVAEATSSNLFLALGGTLVTPSLEANILPGITRREVLRLARAARVPTLERPVAPEELPQADEAFLTNAIVEVLPVRAIDGHPLGPGPLARQLHAAYRQLVQRAVQAAS